MAWKGRTDIGCSENPGVFDTGNGALRYHEINEDHPLVERVRVEYYARGRGQDSTMYSPLVGRHVQSARQPPNEFPTVAAAEAAARESG